MKTKIRAIIIIIILLIGSSMGISFAESDRLVDIPVPPNSSGYADFTEEEAAEQEREYEESKNNITSENLVGKSSDNYLKSLNVEGYKLSPEFNRQRDTYTIYVKGDDINTFNISAEPDNENAKVEGLGNVTVSQDERVINIKVIAENGDLKVYTINVENASHKPNKINIYLIIIIFVILTLIIIVLVKKVRKQTK